MLIKRKGSLTGQNLLFPCDGRLQERSALCHVLRETLSEGITRLFTRSITSWEVSLPKSYRMSSPGCTYTKRLSSIHGKHALGLLKGSIGTSMVRPRCGNWTKRKVGEGVKKISDVQHHRSVTLTIRSPPSQNGFCTRRAIARRAPTLTRVPALPHPTPHRFVVATLQFCHDRQLPTTKGPEPGSPRTKGSHQCPQCREGSHKQHPGGPCCCIRSRPSHRDPGEFLSLPR